MSFIIFAMRLKGYKNHIAQLSKRAKELEIDITNFLSEKQQIGLKYNGNAITIEKKFVASRKRKKEKDNDIINLFSRLGIHNPEKAYAMLKEVQKGDTVEKTKLKFKTTKIIIL